jgi:hypothetical protein
VTLRRRPASPQKWWMREQQRLLPEDRVLLQKALLLQGTFPWPGGTAAMVTSTRVASRCSHDFTTGRAPASGLALAERGNPSCRADLERKTGSVCALSSTPRPPDRSAGVRWSRVSPSKDFRRTAEAHADIPPPFLWKSTTPVRSSARLTGQRSSSAAWEHLTRLPGSRSASPAGHYVTAFQVLG